MRFKEGDLIINPTGRVVLITAVKKDGHTIYYGTYIKHPNYNYISTDTTIYPWENYHLLNWAEKAELL